MPAAEVGLPLHFFSSAQKYFSMALGVFFFPGPKNEKAPALLLGMPFFFHFSAFALLASRPGLDSALTR